MFVLSPKTSLIVLSIAIALALLEHQHAKIDRWWYLSPSLITLMRTEAEPFRKNVEIVRDSYGMAHVYGKRNTDTVFGLAYAHAEDDFLTIQQVMLAGRGQLAAVYGKKMAPNDYLFHMFRVQHTVDTKYDNDDEVGEETRQIADAYAKGLNYYAATHPDEIAASLLYPIRGKDVAAAFVHKIPLMFRLEVVLSHLLTDEDVSKTVPRSFGSNTVAVSPLRTSDNSTFLSVNSHQPWEGHAAWYEAHVHSEEGWDLQGCLLPGSPYPQMGHNDVLGWAMTVNRPDIVDVYKLVVNDAGTHYKYDGEWREFVKRDAPIRVRLWSLFHWTFPQQLLYSEHGPVVQGPAGTFAIRFATWGSVRYIHQGYKVATARTYDEWYAAMSMRDRIPMFNAQYADRNGTVFYVWNAVIPKRNDKYNWSIVLPGDVSEVVWSLDDYEPFTSLPQVLNPSSGFTQNCNSCPYNTTIDYQPPRVSHTYGVEPEVTNRALRYIELLSADESVTFEKFQQYKWDVYYSQQSFVMEQIRRLIEWGKDATAATKTPLLRAALTHIAKWDGSTERGNVYAALCVATVEPFIDTLLWVVGEYPSAAIEHTIQPLVDSLVHEAQALMSAYGRLDVPWGTVNRLIAGDRNLPMSGGPDIIHAVHRKPVDAKTNPVVKRGWAGDGSLQLVRWPSDGGAVEAYGVHQYGVAVGRVTSRHHTDQMELMAERRTRRLLHTREEVLADSSRRYAPGI